MIRENPLGYGAMGARHVLCGIHIVGHPHNVMIELHEGIVPRRK